MPSRSSRRHAGCFISGLLLCSVGLTVGAARAANPVPLINQPLVPAAIAPGGGQFSLTVNGTGFVSGSTVHWNGSSRTTAFVSSSKLTATINASDIASAGTASVTVTSPAPGGGTSNPVSFEITGSNSSVALSHQTLTAGTQPVTVATADFNRDGLQDLAVVNANCLVPPCPNGTLSILLGKGDGTFQPALTSTLAAQPQSIAFGDFNNDGKLDVAVAESGEGLLGLPLNEVSVLLGKGNGTFQAATNYSTGATPVAVATADFNGDGKLDLAVVDELGDTVSVLLGNGDGTFQAHVEYSVDLNPLALAVGDFNGDGKLDLAVVNYLTNTVSVLLGNGDGTFQAPVDYDVSLGPISVVAADFNGDGKLDLAAANELSSTVSVLLGNGDGTFATKVDYDAGALPFFVTIGDFNGDGKLDLAAAIDLLGGGASILLGNGDGTFQSAATYPSGLLPVSIAAADFNKDGRLDLATADFNGDTASILLATTASLSPTSLTFASQSVGTTSPPQNVTLTNAGATSITITSISTSGNFAQTNTCGTALAAGKNCTISVTFTPQSSGTLTGTLTLTDSAVGSPQTVGLSGTGSGASVTLSPSSLTFASQTIGTISAAQTITLTNSGNATLNITSITKSGDFILQGNLCGSTLSAGGSCNLNIAFKPTAPGTRTGTLSVVDDGAGSPQTASLTGTGSGPAVTFAPSSLTFGNQNVGSSSAAQTITLTNTGNQSLSITTISISGTNGGSFSQTNTCPATVNVNASCTISVTFTPTKTGTLTANVSVSDNAYGSPQNATLTGSGVQPAATLSPSTLTFATQLINTTSPGQKVTLTNTGTGSLSITSITTSNTNYGQTNNCGLTVAAGASCTITVTFTPSSQGTHNGNLTVTDNASPATQKVTLNGTGTVVSLSPASLSLGTVKVGQSSSPQNVTLTNDGTKSLSITSISFTGTNPGDFSQTNGCGSSVKAGASCTITVTFKPTATGSRSALLSISDGGGGSPQTVSVSGTGS